MSNKEKYFIDGNEAVAWGAYYAGCRFFAGYPITPATDIFNNMLEILPPEGGIVLQAEDEIAAIGCCIGASMAGLKAMTATSGPGISLFSEHISFAAGSEIPLVIIDVQRLGPSTGSPTRGADGDIQFLNWGSSGGLPAIVLAPVDAADCFTLTMEAFNLAETYRCPVFVASNKEIALTKESIDLDTLERPEVIYRTGPKIKPDNTEPFHPFQTPADKNVPVFLPIGGPVPVRQTSSTHGKDGYITTNPDEIASMLQRMHRKISDDVDRFSFAEIYEAPGAGTLIIAYGVSARAAIAAFRQLQSSPRPVSLLILKTLWPVPVSLIREQAENAEKVLVVEMNLGQYIREIERVLRKPRISIMSQMDGRLITPAKILEAVDGIAA